MVPPVSPSTSVCQCFVGFPFAGVIREYWKIISNQTLWVGKLSKFGLSRPKLSEVCFRGKEKPLALFCGAGSHGMVEVVSCYCNDRVELHGEENVVLPWSGCAFLAGRKWGERVLPPVPVACPTLSLKNWVFFLSFIPPAFKSIIEGRFNCYFATCSLKHDVDRTNIHHGVKKCNNQHTFPLFKMQAEILHLGEGKNNGFKQFSKTAVHNYAKYTNFCKWPYCTIMQCAKYSPHWTSLLGQVCFKPVRNNTLSRAQGWGCKRIEVSSILWKNRDTWNGVQKQGRVREI